MKYIGDKSLSSIIAKILKVFWWVMLVLMILGVPLELIAIFIKPVEGTWLYEIIHYIGIEGSSEKSIGKKVLLFLQIAAVVPTVLLLIGTAGRLFSNFSRNVVFRKNNVVLLQKSAVLLLILSVAAVNLMSFGISLVLFVLTAIFRQGIELQDEIDWTA